MGLVPSPVAVKTKKARKLLMAEIRERELRGIMADYDTGRLPKPEWCASARAKSQEFRNNRAAAELMKYGIIAKST